ncbi:LysR family transcriptional regulator [Piscinibacter sakaiensis]|uniref:LysR family transcriptional regulator n=1 Tax=Piscinibacter sakaiensis TaxID=1547922 RepID=UPI003AAF025C
MQIQLDDVRLFVRIVDLGTLSAAARERDAPVSQVTRSLVRLERACAVRLLHRTTHGLSLTDEGDTFLAYARTLLDATAQLQADLSGKISGPSGWVRVSVSPLLAEAVIVPSLNALYQRHPDIHVDIAADDRIVDMSREGIDVAIRTGTTASETLVARRIGQMTRSLYAAPAYAERFGLPTSVDDLPRHRLISYSVSPALNHWTIADGAQRREFLAQGHTRTDNSAIVLALVRRGVGIGRLSDVVARRLVASGELLPVMAEQASTEPVPMYAVMLPQRHRLPKIRACIDHWADWMAADR